MFIAAVYGPDVDAVRLAVNVADDGCTLQEQAGRSDVWHLSACTEERTSG